MTEQEHSEPGFDAAGGGVLGLAGRAASTWIGAALSLALMAGVAVWFYRLGTRDASQIPVIRAAAGPAKERPEDPGGDEAPHQEIRSYALVESGAVPGTAPEPRPEVAPPPPQPLPGDGPMRSAPPRSRPEAPAAPVIAVPGEAAPAIEPDTTVADLGAASDGSDPVRAPHAAPAPIEPDPGSEAPAAAPAPGPEPDALPQLPPELLAEALAEVPPEELPEDPGEATIVPVSEGPAPSVSPRARARPPGLVARFRAAEAEAPASREEEVRALALAAASSPIQVQLGAFESPEITRANWDSIRRAHEDVLGGRELSVQTTVSGGKTWYRLRVGPFRDGAEARNVCAALQARGQDCIVARNG